MGELRKTQNSARTIGSLTCLLLFFLILESTAKSSRFSSKRMQWPATINSSAATLSLKN